MSNIISQSKEMSHEYCCTVVRIGEIFPIEGADNIVRTVVNGRDIVIDKTHKEGDIMIYASNECQLLDKFLAMNNLYEDISLNSNYNDITDWLEGNTDATEDEVKDYLRANRGYFGKLGRVRMKHLRGAMSMGFLFPVESLYNWLPGNDGLKMMVHDEHFRWEDHVDEDFDTVAGTLMVQAYVPPVKEHHTGIGREGKRNRRLKKFDRMIPGQFSFHYDTQQFERNIHRFNPDTPVDVTVKVHGTSAIIGNIKVKTPRWGGIYNWMFPRLPKFLQFTNEKYDIVESSRTVIINNTINPDHTIGYASGMVQKTIAHYAELLKNYIPAGITYYGEIVGYYEGSDTPIQKIDKPYDYGCNPGENKFMIYRITAMMEDGTKKEYTVREVMEYVESLRYIMVINGDEKLADRMMMMTSLYSGTLGDLYKDVDRDEKWNTEVLNRMKYEKAWMMEQNEPLCKNKVPREGVVIRISNDAMAEAFKLKCLKFLGKEAEAMDRGETTDVEMQERYN